MYKSVVFLMPCIGRTPVGGFKVVYEYANRLVNDGFDVKIVYPATYDFSAYNATGFSDFSFKNKVRIICVICIIELTVDILADRGFSLIRESWSAGAGIYQKNWFLLLIFISLRPFRRQRL